jgi:hypothetical protein
VELPRYHRPRTSGNLGRLTRRLPSDPAVQWWNWHDNYATEAAAPNPKWLDILTDPVGPAKRRREEEAKESVSKRLSISVCDAFRMHFAKLECAPAAVYGPSFTAITSCVRGSIRRLLFRFFRSPLPLFGSRLFGRSDTFLERSPLHFVPNGTEDRIQCRNFEIRGLIPHDQPAGHSVRFCPHFARK